MRYFSQFLSNLISEFRGILRGLVRRPGYAIAAWVMLGLAVAANAAVFAIVYGFILKPLPYANPNQLSVIRESEAKTGLNANHWLVSVKHYLLLRKELPGIAEAGLSTWANGAPVKINHHTRLLGFEHVTSSLFSTLGVQPILGRLPAPSADRPGGPPEAVISKRLWESAYGGKKDVLGKMFTVNAKTYRIVGVMPGNFFFETSHMDAWLPYVITPMRAQSMDPNYWMVVRRKPGVSPKQLDLELQNQRRMMLAKTPPAARKRAIAAGYELDATSLRVAELRFLGVGHLPWLLQAAAGFLLLLALANTINLGLVRQRARRHEFALRRALGSSRNGLVRLIFVEHLPIAIAVGVSAMLLDWAGINALHAVGLPPTFSPFHITLTPAVIAFIWITTVLSVLAVISGPALLAGGKKLLAGLGHGPTDAGGRTPRRIQRGLGVVQIGLACALVIASGLLGISLWRIFSQPIGFVPQHRIEATIISPHDVKKSAAWASLKPRLEQLPGVDSVAASNMIPFSQVGSVRNSVRKSGATQKTAYITSNAPPVTSRFFSTLGIKLLGGRSFTAEEVSKQASVVVLNAALAKRFFGSVNNAIGKSVDMGGAMRVIGVAQDIAWQPTPDQYRRYTTYVPFGSDQQGVFIVVAKTSGPVAPLMAAMKNSIHNALPNSMIFRMATLPHLIQGASVLRSTGAGLVGTFAALALLLAALGVFAITLFIARSRLGEYGIRAALGAGPSALLRLGFREAAWLLAIGLPIGLIGAYLLGQVIAGALYQTPVFDAGLYASGIVIIAAVVLAAAWGPAHRAARMPVRSLIGGDGVQ